MRISVSPFPPGSCAHGNLGIGQLAILPQKKDFLLVRSQRMQALANALEGLRVFYRLGRNAFVGQLHDVFSQKRFDPASPGATLHIPGGVQADPENPGPQVADVAQALASPATQKHFLSNFLGVVAISQNEPQRAEQFIAELVERRT